MYRNLQVLSGIALTGASIACARYAPAPGYEMLARTPAPAECYERPSAITPAPMDSIAAGAQRGARAFVGVVQDEYARPVRGAAVDLRGDSAFSARTDSAGRFSFPGVPAGSYRVQVRAVGHNRLNAEIALAAAARQAYRVVVPVLIFDGPCSAVIVVKKPWWKW